MTTIFEVSFLSLCCFVGHTQAGELVHGLKQHKLFLLFNIYKWVDIERGMLEEYLANREEINSSLCTVHY